MVWSTLQGDGMEPGNRPDAARSSESGRRPGDDRRLPQARPGSPQPSTGRMLMLVLFWYGVAVLGLVAFWVILFGMATEFGW